MTAFPGQTPGMEQFEAYFQRADLDRDGRISGIEAVAFLQGSNLPRQILAQIWTHSDQKNCGFLGRAEFYNALRLVTVAQSGRELTADIVKAALGPAAAKIPAPKINSVPTPTPPVNTVSAPGPQLNSVMPSSAQPGSILPTASQNIGFRGPQPQGQPQIFPNAGLNQQVFPSTGTTRPYQAMPASSTLPVQPASQGLSVGAGAVGPRLPSSNVANLSTDWFAGRTGGASAGGPAPVPSRDNNTMTNQDGFGLSNFGPTASATPGLQAASADSTKSAPLPPKPASPLFPPSQPTDKDVKALVVSGNGFSSDSVFGGDMFSATQPKQDASATALPASRTPITSNAAAITTGFQSSVAPQRVGSSPSSSTGMVRAGPVPQSQLLVKQSQFAAMPSTSGPSSGIGVGAPGANLAQSQWPKMSQFDIQKYTKVFVEVDKDRDGKITGEEARNLFLSWRLPREVLKQVWDLSDQDSDSMLSFREFCIALYLMERYREGRPLPATLPNSLLFDDSLLQATSQPSVRQGGPVWQPSPGFTQQGVPGARPVMPTAGAKPQQQVQMVPQNNGQMQPPVQKKSSIPVLEKHLVNQLSSEEQSAVNSKFKEAEDADKKVQELEKEIMDSKEKIEFYRTKMQELVLYKSRCDNRLNEIIERASSDKCEVEALTKKYEDKYKQVGDVASKLTVEEATFRDIQEKKLELYNAIVKINEGGSADGVLQVRAERIQSDLEELVKALNSRCKKYGLHAKPTALIELPFGWQPGIQEGAADWDEDWDKFGDEGFMLVKELTVDVENIIAPPKSKSSAYSRSSSKDDTASAAAPDIDRNVENPSSTGERVPGSESAYAQSEDGSVRSLPSSPLGRVAVESPSKEFNSPKYGTNDVSPRVKDNQSDHGGAESTISGEKSADEHPWGATFDTNDDADSIWGFDPINKESGDERNKPYSFFDSGDFGLNPIRTESPSAASVYGKEKGPFFDSVPGTPSFNSGFSPRFSEGPDHSFDGLGAFDRFDSFSTPGNLTRFDSMRSSKEFDHGGFFSQHEPNLARFDSILSTRDSDHIQGFSSFDDTDPFSAGPFKASESNTPRKASDNWSSF